MREVCIWVEHIGLGQFRKKFAHHAIDGRVLAALTDEHLKADLQITGLGHRFKLLEEIAALAGRAPDGRGPGPGPRTPRERAEARRHLLHQRAARRDRERPEGWVVGGVGH